MSAVMSPLAAGDAKLDACPKCGAKSASAWLRQSQICVPCENKRVLDKVKAQDRNELAHLLASTDAVIRIQRLCIVTGSGWFDPQFAVSVPGPETDMLRLGIRYLDQCGLIESHPAFPLLFRLVANGT